MSKKAVIAYEPLVVLGFFIALTTGLLITLKDTRTSIDKPVGKVALELLQQTYDSEAALFYVDQLAEYSANDAIIELGLNGMQYADRRYGCDVAALPEPIIINSFPKMTEIADSYLKIFKRNLNDRLKQNNLPTEAGAWLKLADYKFYFEPNPVKISGIAAQPMEIGLFAGTGDTQLRMGEYYLRPSFTAAVDYDFKVYADIAAGLDKLNNRASELSEFSLAVTSELGYLVSEFNTQQTELLWEMSATADGYYLFKITHNKQILLCNQKPVVQFALNMRSVITAPPKLLYSTNLNQIVQQSQSTGELDLRRLTLGFNETVWFYNNSEWKLLAKGTETGVEYQPTSYDEFQGGMFYHTHPIRYQQIISNIEGGKQFKTPKEDVMDTLIHIIKEPLPPTFPTDYALLEKGLPQAVVDRTGVWLLTKKPVMTKEAYDALESKYLANKLTTEPTLQDINNFVAELNAAGGEVVFKPFADNAVIEGYVDELLADYSLSG